MRLLYRKRFAKLLAIAVSALVRVSALAKLFVIRTNIFKLCLNSPSHALHLAVDKISKDYFIAQ